MIKVYCTNFLRGHCKYGPKCKYYHQKNICYICNILTKDVINIRYLKSFCNKCKNNNPIINNYNSLINKELLILLSYYITEIEDLINLYKSGYFPFINYHEYWINRIIFENKQIPYYMVKEVISKKSTFIDILIYYYYDLPNMKFIDEKTIYTKIKNEYKNIFQRNMLNYKSNKKVKVTYIINTKVEIRDNYIKTLNNYAKVYYDLPYNIKEIDVEILKRSNNSMRKYIPKLCEMLSFNSEYIIENVIYDLITECIHNKDEEGFCDNGECTDDRYYGESLYESDKTFIEEISKCKKCNFSLIHHNINEYYDDSCSSCNDIFWFY